MFLGWVPVPMGMQGQAAMTSLGAPVPHKGESQPQAGLLVMPSRMTLLMALSHPGTFTPGRAGGGSAFTWDTSLLAGEQGGSAASTGTAPQTPARDRGTRGHQHRLEPEEGDTVLHCLAGMPGWEAGD